MIILQASDNTGILLKISQLEMLQTLKLVIAWT